MMQKTNSALRKIIKIDDEKCDGCGKCIPNCPEGAIQMIEGKARLVSDLCCDGLGACLGHCPRGAITIEERQAEPYDERKVIENVFRQGPAVVRAHLQHLAEHRQTEYLEQAKSFLREKGFDLPSGHAHNTPHHAAPGGCPGARAMSFAPVQNSGAQNAQPQTSQLGHWPIQLHLLNPHAPHYHGSDLLLAADCVPFALAGFHNSYLKGKTLAIACPKLDEGQDIYLQKLIALIDDAQVNTITVIIMQVPCCGGLLHLALAAARKAARRIPIKRVIVSLQGAILEETWCSQ